MREIRPSGSEGGVALTTPSLPYRLDLLQRRVHTVDIIVIVQRIEKIGDLFSGRLAQFGEILGEVSNLRRDDIPTSRLQRLRDRVQLLDFGQESGSFVSRWDFVGFQRFDFLRARFNRVGFRIAICVRMSGLDDAQMVEKETDASRL